MLKAYVNVRETLLRLRDDQSGVVSFEYVIVAACVVGAVGAAFGTGTASGIGAALQTAINAIVTKIGTFTA